MSDEKSSTTKSRAPLRWPRARARAPPRLFAHEFLLVRFSPSDHAKASTASLDHRSRTRQSATSRIPIGACATSSSRCTAAATPLCRRSRRSGDATRFLCALQARRRRTAATPPCARRASKLRTTATPTTSALRKWSWPRTGNISASDWRSSLRASAAGEDRGTCRTRRPDHGQHSKGAHPNESGRSGSTLAKAGPRCVPFLLGSYLSSSSYRPLCPAQYIPRRPDEYYAACGDWISWEHFLSVPVGKEADDLESLTPKVRTDLERRAERMTARWEERRKCDDADES